MPEASTGPFLLALPEPTFQRPAVSFPITGSEQTVETFAYWNGEKLRPLTVVESARLDRENPDWRQQAHRAADHLIDAVTLRWVRDDSGVIQGVFLEGTEPTTAALLFSPALLEHFEDILGPEFLATVPSRLGMVLIPRLASDPGAFASSVLTEYRRSSQSISPEVFLLGDGPPKAIGQLDDR
jgi:hypothetical protein